MNTSRSERIKIFAGIVVIAFSIALAVIVGNRLSNEALAVLAGVVCGVSAAIPTSLLVVWVSRRQEDRHVRPGNGQGAYPPVVVVAPPGGQPQYIPPQIEPMGQRPARQFTIVGDGYE
jgi:hypothetical protein